MSAPDQSSAISAHTASEAPAVPSSTQTSGNGEARPNWLSTGLRWVLGLVLIWAGLSKLVDPVAFHGAILEYRLPLPPLSMKSIAVILPWLELFCGLLLFTGFARRAALLWVFVLFTGFLAMIALAYARGLDISCGCFNLAVLGIDPDSPAGHTFDSISFALFRNIVLWLGASFLLLNDFRRPRQSYLPTRTRSRS